MNRYARTFAMIPQDTGKQDTWLTYMDEFGHLRFVAATPDSNESPRDALDNQVPDELGISRDDFLISSVAQINLEFAAILPHDVEPSHVIVSFYLVNMYRSRALTEISNRSDTMWLTRAELLSGNANSGASVCPNLTFLLQKADVLPYGDA